jgi:hypothetical protein
MNGILIWILGIFFLASCLRTPSTARLYALSPIEHSKGVVKAPSGVTVALGPVLIPSMIDRPQLIVRSEENRIQVFEESRWAGSLKEDIIRVLVENLNILMIKEGISVFTDEFIVNPSLYVSVTINRFDGRLNDRVWLNAAWMIRESNSKIVPTVNISSIEEPVGSPEIESLVSAKSRALALLGREIARELIIQKSQSKADVFR